MIFRATPSVVGAVAAWLRSLRTGRWRVAALLLLAAAVPVAVMVAYTAGASRNIVYWDEIDTVIDLLLKLDAGLGSQDFWASMFAINNEHRMLTSRLLFVASWWLVGTVDFRVVGAIGNLFLVVLCALLVWSAGTSVRRVRMGVLLAFLLFQLEHFENFLWSGASIDHFQVVALAVAAVIGCARGSRLGFFGGAGCALLATFTLAHGLVTWPVVALMLWQMRRRRELAIWAALAGVAVATFFHGFEINAGHRIAGFDAVGVGHMLRYWLALLGAPLALGEARLAPFAGVVLLGAIGGLAWIGAWRREAIAGGATLFCVGALALVALGRSEVDGGLLQSRYMVLAALPWALVAFVAIERWSSDAHPHRRLAWLLPVLVVFNASASVHYLPRAEAFIEGRDRAALRFKQHGRDGGDHFRLYPEPERGSRLINEAARRGLYYIPRMCVRENLRELRPSSRIQYFVDEMTVDTRAIYISGWAAIPEEVSRRGKVYLVLRSKDSLIVYTTVAMSRPDVAAASGNPGWRLSGFQFAVGRWRLPPEELQLGILVKHGDHAEYIMTEHRLRPYGRGEALLAAGG